MDIAQQFLSSVTNDRPILIAGPTASGKSALALCVANLAGGLVVNADALQVYSNWRLLTARPSDEDLAQAPHALYGHIAPDQDYSVGHWLREVEALMATGQRLIIIGGTGLYFSALTEGLAEIPPTPPEIRAEADLFMATQGAAALLAELDAKTCERIDRLNPARIQRAWEVLRATGTGLATWQDQTPPPLLPLDRAAALVIDAPADWLNPRIERRFDAMMAAGALDEARANLPNWDPKRPASRAIGGPELIDFLHGKKTLDEAREAAIISSRQYAKRQRTWFRSRMQHWTTASAPGR